MIEKDFKKFHKIYAMDTQNYRDLMRLCSNEEECNKVALILSTTNKEQRLDDASAKDSCCLA